MRTFICLHFCSDSSFYISWLRMGLHSIKATRTFTMNTIYHEGILRDTDPDKVLALLIHFCFFFSSPSFVLIVSLVLHAMDSCMHSRIAGWTSPCHTPCFALIWLAVVWASTTWRSSLSVANLSSPRQSVRLCMMWRRSWQTLPLISRP